MIKEVSSYEKEVIQNEARIQKMRDENKDEYGLPFLRKVSCFRNLFNFDLNIHRYSQTGRGPARELYDGT